MATTDPSTPDVGASTELAHAGLTAAPVGYSSAALISDDEIATLWRVAQALAASQMFKDTTQAAQAFAKLIIGRDLGLSPAQAMTLYVMEGKVEVPYPMLARFIRQRPGYDFSVRWLNNGETTTDADPDLDGCEVTFTVNDKIRATSTWTKADTERAGLQADRGSKKSNHVKFPRNMYLARALSNGVKWHVPEVMGGLPLYAEGELPRADLLGAGQGSGEGPGWGDMPLDQVRLVMNVIERAKTLGHAGLSATETVQQRLNGQSPEFVTAWITVSMATLDEMAATVAREAAITDADVVADPLTLTFGGEVFTFNDTDDPYAMIAAALAEGPESMEAVAIDLGSSAAMLDDREPAGMDWSAESSKYRAMAAALHREAQERKGTE